MGSGKSTLVNVIPRVLEVDDGQVFIDGVDVNRVPVAVLRSSIAMVPQDSFLFSTTIAENIRFGRPDATMDEVREAARRAHVLGDIEEFPQGFETPVGERGITLSGGQRQRVALARALLLDPRILILDDSLSSVDHATEESILGELQRARAGRTCFIVAHRVSAVRGADQILVLEDGRIAQRGTHAQLVAAGGFYARLHRRQQLEEEIEGGLETEASAADGRGAAGGRGMSEPRSSTTPAGQHLHEEEALGKVYDADLLRRLWPFMRPYRGQVWFSLALIPLRAALEVMPPLIIGAALDYLTRGEVTSSIAWLTPVLQPPAVAAVPELIWLFGVLLAVASGLLGLEWLRGWSMIVLGPAHHRRRAAPPVRSRPEAAAALLRPLSGGPAGHAPHQRSREPGRDVLDGDRRAGGRSLRHGLLRLRDLHHRRRAWRWRR